MNKLRFYGLIAALAVSFQVSAQQPITADSTAKILMLVDTAGRLVNLHDFHGKVVVADFWFTGCGGCQNFYNLAFRPLKEHYKGDDRVVFVSISTDRDMAVWRKSIREGIYTDSGVLNLSTGRSTRHPLIYFYGITGYPSALVIGKTGKEKVLHWVNSRNCCSFEDLLGLIELELKLPR